MIKHVEVTLKPEMALFKDNFVEYNKITSWDSEEQRKTHPNLIANNEYTSVEQLIEVISQKLKVEKNNITVIADDAIKDDEDTKAADLYKDGSIYPYRVPDEVEIRDDKMSVYEWLRKLKHKRLILNPEFQRHFVWPNEKKSR
ncbi:MAG: hypothetical protein GY757_06080, partial [bacterium]|nr:hypothetical protein [bacterium]